MSASAVPYGKTITVWGSGALLIHFRHLPTVWEIFLFVAGAVGAIAALWMLGRGVIEENRPLSQGAAPALAGVLDIFAVGFAGSPCLRERVRLNAYRYAVARFAVAGPGSASVCDGLVSIRSR